MSIKKLVRRAGLMQGSPPQFWSGFFLSEVAKLKKLSYEGESQI
jgi:putative methionine-R-sulfoxide reductase with GAF domain